MRALGSTTNKFRIDFNFNFFNTVAGEEYAHSGTMEEVFTPVLRTHTHPKRENSHE